MGSFCTRGWDGGGSTSKLKNFPSKLNLFVFKISNAQNMSYYDGCKINEAKLTEMVSKMTTTKPNDVFKAVEFSFQRCINKTCWWN